MSNTTQPGTIKFHYHASDGDFDCPGCGSMAFAHATIKEDGRWFEVVASTVGDEEVRLCCAQQESDGTYSCVSGYSPRFKGVVVPDTAQFVENLRGAMAKLEGDHINPTELASLLLRQNQSYEQAEAWISMWHDKITRRKAALNAAGRILDLLEGRMG